MHGGSFCFFFGAFIFNFYFRLISFLYLTGSQCDEQGPFSESFVMRAEASEKEISV